MYSVYFEKVKHEYIILYIFHSFFLSLTLGSLTFLFMINKQTRSFLRPVEPQEREASAPPYSSARTRRNATFFNIKRSMSEQQRCLGDLFLLSFLFDLFTVQSIIRAKRFTRRYYTATSGSSQR